MVFRDRARNSVTALIVVLMACMVSAHDEELPWLYGGLGWSADGQYIAVATSQGVRIHNSDDLSLVSVLDESTVVTTLDWSTEGLKIAYDSEYRNGIIVWDLETEQRLTLDAPGTAGITSIEWSPGGARIAAGHLLWPEIYIWNAESRALVEIIPLSLFSNLDYGHVEWSPDGRYLATGSISRGLAIFDSAYRFQDFRWNKSGSRPTKWSPDGTMLAAGRDLIKIWEIHPEIHHRMIDEFIGDLVYVLDGRFVGLSWHPDSEKLAFIDISADSAIVEGSRTRAAIWDIATDSVRRLPCVLVYWDYVDKDGKVISWSPDGIRLAAISNDGRIIIWNTITYEVVAEYDGYRSIVDYYAEKDFFSEQELGSARSARLPCQQ